MWKKEGRGSLCGACASLGKIGGLHAALSLEKSRWRRTGGGLEAGTRVLHPPALALTTRKQTLEMCVCSLWRLFCIGWNIGRTIIFSFSIHWHKSAVAMWSFPWGFMVLCSEAEAEARRRHGRRCLLSYFGRRHADWMATTPGADRPAQLGSTGSRNSMQVPP